MTNIVPVERTTGWTEDSRTGVQAAGGKWNVGRDHDIAIIGMPGDPVIGSVRIPRYQDTVQQPVPGEPERTVGHHVDGQIVPLRNPHHFALDRAGISIDQDLRHRIRTVRP